MVLNKTNDFTRTGQACWFRFWLKIWKLIKKWPPYPPKREFNPLMGEIFFRGWYENLIGLGLFIRLSYNPSWWEKSEHLDFGAPRGVKVGVIGGSWGSKIKYGSKCLKLPNSSRKVVFSILKFFHLICKILRKISTLKIFLSIFHFGLKFSKLRKPLFSMN